MPLFPPFVHTEQIMCSTKMSKLPAGITQSGSTCGFSVLWQDLYLIFYFLFCSLFEDNKCNKKHLLSLAAEHLFIWNWAIFRTEGRGLLLIMKAEILLRSQHIRFEVLFLSQRACPSVSGNKCQLEHKIKILTNLCVLISTESTFCSLRKQTVQALSAVIIVALNQRELSKTAFGKSLFFFFLFLRNLK